MITIVDYGMGNLGSIQNVFKYIGVEVSIESKIKTKKGDII
jgi:glutamine amidotransferase